MLKAQGKDFVDHGQKIVLTGFNFCGWMQMENFQIGFPGVEQQFRGYLAQYAGRDKAEHFFDRFLTQYVQEADIAFIKAMGCNHVRLNINYRHFESDQAPMQFKAEGFRHLDRVLELLAKYGMYGILEIHGAQGYQNPDWHSDNATNKVGLFQNQFYQQRLIALWRFIAEHYKDNVAVGGYEIMNEPWAEADEIDTLVDICKQATAAIRQVDKEHIVFIEANLFGKTYEGFPEPWDDNMACSVHQYPYPSLNMFCYPALNEGGSVFYNKDYIAYEMDIRDGYGKKYNLPVWMSEFGIVHNDDFREDKLRLLEDQLAVMDERGHSWALCCYKDVGNMGVVRLDPNSAWMQFVKESNALKLKYHTDFDPLASGSWEMMDVVKHLFRADFTPGSGEVEARLHRHLAVFFGEELCMRLCKRLAQLSLDELDTLMDSFKFENCLVREDWKAILTAHTK